MRVQSALDAQELTCRTLCCDGASACISVVNYNDPNLTTEYQSFMTYLEGPRDVGRICGKLSSVTIATIIGTIQGVGQGAPAYSVACGDLNDVGARPTWSWFAHNLEYGLRPNMGGQGSRKDAASMALTVRARAVAVARASGKAREQLRQRSGHAPSCAPHARLRLRAAPLERLQARCTDAWDLHLARRET